MTDHAAKTFVVTGANSGVGLETARGLARTGASVVMTARNREKGEAALADIRASTGNDKVRLQMLDLASLASVQRAAEELGDACDRLDVLVNNAGLGTAQPGRTEDGFELTMGTNHIGPFALTEALLPHLLDTARRHGEARIVNVSSLAHNFARRFDPNELMPARGTRGRDAYSESKLANLLHARELAARYGEEGLIAHAVHPGFVDSGFLRPEHFPGPWQLVNKVTKPLQISAVEGAKPSLYAALSDEAGRLNGFYWVKERTKPPYLPNDVQAVQRQLWATTEGLIANARSGAVAA